LTLNGNNALGFQAVLSGSSTTNNALYIKPSGSTPQLLARKGDVAPGGAGGTFNNLTSGNFVLNNNQFAAFRSDLTGVPDNVSGIWAGTPGNLQYVARQGDPTSLAGITYSNTLSSPILMGNNKVAFFSTIAGTGIVSGNDQALWYGDPGSIQLLARTGDAAGSTGLFFRNFYQTFHARSDGSIAFAAQVATSATGGTLRDSLWIVSPSDVSLVVLQGTSITLGPDNLPRTVGSIRMLDANFSGDSDGYSRGMADDGTLGAEIGFPGFQTGVIITAVPEASTVLSLAGAIAGAGAFIWYRRNARQALLSQMVTGEE
jgi:hypothetical protein